MKNDDIMLTPSFNGADCIGNGEHEEIECQCDECDFYLECFPCNDPEINEVAEITKRFLSHDEIKNIEMIERTKSVDRIIEMYFELDDTENWIYYDKKSEEYFIYHKNDAIVNLGYKAMDDIIEIAVGRMFDNYFNQPIEPII